MDVAILEQVLIKTWLIQFIILLRVSKPAMGTLVVCYAHYNLVAQCMKYGDVIIAGALVIDITAGKYVFMNFFSRWKPIDSVFFFFAFLYFLYKSNR